MYSLIQNVIDLLLIHDLTVKNLVCTLLIVKQRAIHSLIITHAALPFQTLNWILENGLGDAVLGYPVFVGETGRDWAVLAACSDGFVEFTLKALT